MSDIIDDDFELIGTDVWKSWTLFLHAYKVIVGSIDKELSSVSGVSLSEYEILHQLALAKGRMRFIDLSKVTLLSQSRISRQIDALQAKGYLVREITASDRRATYAVLTDRGVEVFHNAKGPFAKVYGRVFRDRIEDADLGAFMRVLKGLQQDPSHMEGASAIFKAAREANANFGAGRARPKPVAQARGRKQQPR